MLNIRSTRQPFRNNVTMFLAIRKTYPACQKVKLRTISVFAFYLRLYASLKTVTKFEPRNIAEFSEMSNLSLTDSNSDTDTCRSLNMLPRAKPPTPNYPYGHKDFDGEQIYLIQKILRFQTLMILLLLSSFNFSYHYSNYKFF